MLRLVKPKIKAAQSIKYGRSGCKCTSRMSLVLVRCQTYYNWRLIHSPLLVPPAGVMDSPVVGEDTCLGAIKKSILSNSNIRM